MRIGSIRIFGNAKYVVDSIAGLGDTKFIYYTRIDGKRRILQIEASGKSVYIVDSEITKLRSFLLPI